MAAAIPPKVSRIVDIFVSIAAAVVIVGALFKLEHWKGADTMLIIGLGTEAVVFTVYGLLYLRYPAIDDHQVKLAGADTTTGNPALKTMEKNVTGCRYHSGKSHTFKFRLSKTGYYR